MMTAASTCKLGQSRNLEQQRSFEGGEGGGLEGSRDLEITACSRVVTYGCLECGGRASVL